MGALDKQHEWDQPIELPEQASKKLHREGRLWLLQDARNYLLDVLDSVAFPQMLPGEREKLEVAREVLATLKRIEEER